MIGTVIWTCFCFMLAVICFMGSAQYFSESNILLGAFTACGGALWVQLGFNNGRA